MTRKIIGNNLLDAQFLMLIVSIMLNVSDIVKRCGGRKVIAQEINGVSYDAVRKWEGFGIPERHWMVVKRLHKGRLSEKMLHEMNERLRQEVAA